MPRAKLAVEVGGARPQLSALGEANRDLSCRQDFTPRSRARIDAAFGSARSLPAPAPDAPRVCFSGVAPAELQTLQQVALAHGAAVVDDPQSCTHLVLGRKGTPPRPKRTLKVLHAVLRGCWLLEPPWLLASLDSGRLLPEAAYELAGEGGFPTARRARVLVEEGASLQPLSGIAVFVNDKDVEQHATYIGLLRAAGATLAPTLRGAAVCIGPHAPRRNAPRVPSRSAIAVRPEWLMDSIMALEALPYDAYAHHMPVA